MNNRLQFRHHNEVFATREAAIEFIQSQIRFATEGLAADDKRLGYSLFAEPTVLRYVNEEDETNPHVIMAIGSVTNEGTQYNENKFCIIDIDKTEAEIADLEEEISEVIKSLTLITKDTDTLKLYAEKTEEGTYVSGDVKVAESHIFNDVREYNNLMVTPEGLFLYVNLTYDENTEVFTFTVNNADGTLSETSVKLPNNYLTSGYYSVQDQSIHLKMRESDDIVIDCKYLIAEWDVEGDESKSPIVLTKEEVDFDVDDNSRLKPWQDVLRADVRIKDESFDPVTGKPVYDEESLNILRRTPDKKYLYVDGKASNIVYYMDGQKSNVKEALDKLGKIKLSSDYSNILQEKTDGFFASAKLNYISKENTLVFKVSNQDETRLKLNSFRLFESVYYDPTKEALVITYIDGNDELQIVEIPIGQMLTEWEVFNEGHNVYLDKSQHSVEGKDILTADVKIFQGHNNILTDTNHTLYVRGEADNIKYLPTGDTTVKDVLDELKAEDTAINRKIAEEIARAEGEEERIEDKLDQEIADRTADVERIDTTIGSGFSTDTHETVTYKFEELQAQVDLEAEKLQNEIDRSTAKDEEHDEAIADEIARATEAEEILTDKIGTGFTTDPHENVTAKFEELQAQVDLEAEKLQNEIDRSVSADTIHDGRLDAIDAEIGDGFGPRNTVRDEIENLQSEIDAVSADSSSRLSDVINEDESIDIETRADEAGKPTVKVVKVNISTEIEDEKPNIIKLNADGLYAGVDLSYEETANKLIFKTTNGTKEIQLESMSSIIDIRYDASKEALIITYMTNGHEIKTVEIPLADLIREWKPSENTDGAIKLTLTEAPSGTTGKDILYGEVLISDHEDNILINDGGKLYVSNSEITANTAAIEALDDRMNTAEADIDTLQEGLREESSARTLADEALGRRIDQEIEDRTADVDAEQSRAEAAELALSNKIDADVLAEKNRAISAETTLDVKINQEVADRQADVDAEESRAISAETALSNKIDADILTEKNRAISAETVLDTKINQEIVDRQADVDAEESRAISAETALSNKIETDILAEKNRAISAETALDVKINQEVADRQADVDAEESRAKAAELTLSGKIDTDILAEQSRAISAETALSNKIDTDILAEKNRAISAETALDTKIEQEITDRIADVDAEESRAKAAELALSGKIDTDILAEKNRAISAETALQEALNREIHNREDDVDAEQSRAEAAELALSGKIDTDILAEQSRAISAETALDAKIGQEVADRQADVDAEQSRAEAAELALSGKIDTDILAEKNRAISAETALNTKINQETTNRIAYVDAEQSRAEAAELALSNKIDADILVEKNRAVSAETALDAKIDQEVADRQADVDAEQSRAEAAETALQEALNREVHNREDDVDAEQSRAEAAELALSNKINADVLAEKNRAVSAETVLLQTISGETTRATSEEARIETKLDNEISTARDNETRIENALNSEISRATNEELSIRDALTSETLRAQAADNELYQKIADEIADRRTGEGELREAITDEASRAQVVEGQLSSSIVAESGRATSEEARIETKLDNEIIRSTNADNVLTNALNSEITRATSAETILNSKINEEERRASAEELALKIALSGETYRAISAETALQNADNVLTTNLANEISRAISAETALQVQVDANKLAFHDSTTIDLVRSEGNPDVVVGHVKIATSNNNIIRVDESSYGIYASVDLTYDRATNVLTFTASDGTNKNLELSSGSVIHRAWFDPTTEELVLEFVNPDGTFYTVEIPVGSLFNQWDVDNENSKGIRLIKTPGSGSGSTDLLSAEVKISQSDDNILTLKDNHLYVSGSGITKALSDSETISGNLETLRTAVNGTSEGYTYPNHVTSHIISAATSYDEADMLLDAAFYEMMDKWFLVGFETCTTHSEVKQIEQNRHMLVDVRLSHGNKATGMTDEELSMTDMDDKYFSDTNVLRYINVTETRDHQHLNPDNGYNGMYLSNYWDCGKYYQTETEDTEIAEMVAEGYDVYNTNYKTDETESASDYNYNNNVRQNP